VSVPRRLAAGLTALALAPLTATAAHAADAAAPPVPQIVTYTTHPQGSWVALTFDDGPDPIYTRQVLALLHQYHLKATFCLVGRQAQAHPELVRAIVADGHRLCDHTMSHDEHLPTKSPAQVSAEITGGRQAILQAVPKASIAYYRAPGGVWSATERQVAGAQSMQPLGWTVDTRDWTRPGVPAILDAVHRELHPGGVILLHDGGGNREQSIAALRRLIPTLLTQGYHFDFPA